MVNGYKSGVILGNYVTIQPLFFWPHPPCPLQAPPSLSLRDISPSPQETICSDLAVANIVDLPVKMLAS